MKRVAFVIVVLAAIAVALPRSVAAGAPTDQLRGQVDRVLDVLKDSGLEGSARRAAVRQVADGIFDFEETARRALGPHWQPRTPAERQEFVRLFADLLEDAYLSKIDRYQGEKVSWLGDTVDGNQATVRTRIVTPQGSEIPVDYRMHRGGDRWLIHDVLIEGVSLVANYRTQFNRIIRSSSYGDLVARMKSRGGALREGGPS
jgi:phospholipid transport system substrate-binding protein